MATIFEKARELGVAIIESEEYKELKKAELEQENDEEALEKSNYYLKHFSINSRPFLWISSLSLSCFK